MTVNFATADGTATMANDYQFNSGTLTFLPGETSKDVTVLVNGDMTNEADETFLVNLSTPTNATLSDSQGVGTINNDDPVVAVAITPMRRFRVRCTAACAPGIITPKIGRSNFRSRVGSAQADTVLQATTTALTC